MFQLLKKFTKKFNSYERLIEITVDKGRLLSNLKTYQLAYSDLKIAPVLKSNAYGHGLALVAEILDNQGLPFFCLDSFFEANVLRQQGIKTPLLVIGYTQPENIFKNNIKNLCFTISDLTQLKQISSHLKYKTFFHLKLDTGMHRQGLMPDQFLETIRLVEQNENIAIEGLLSHLADADSEDETFTQQQIAQWNNDVIFFKEHFPKIKYFHLAASAGIAFSESINANCARLGIGLYGFNPSAKNNLNLLPALELKSQISSIRKIEPQEKVGYNITFQANEKTTIATIPAGYYEGVNRRLSNCGFVQILGQFCPIVGRISMNMTTVSINNVTNAAVGNAAVLISKNPKDKNSVTQIAELCQTIPYEILVRLPQHLKRTII